MPWLDRELRPITLARWRELYGDPGYRIVRRTTRKQLVVETSWIGFASVSEKVPRPFLVEVYHQGGDGVVRLDGAHWYATEAEALAGHQAARIRAA
jgi:hypothetical protein